VYEKQRILTHTTKYSEQTLAVGRIQHKLDIMHPRRIKAREPAHFLLPKLRQNFTPAG